MAADIRVAAGHGVGSRGTGRGVAAHGRRGVPGYVTPKVAVGAVVGNDEGQILLIQRARLGRVAVPDRMGRCRLLGLGGGGQGGGRGDRYRGRAAAVDRGPRRVAARVHQRPAVLARVPLPGGWWRAANATPSRPAMSAGSPRTPCRRPWRARTGGVRRRSPPSEASPSTWSSTVPASRRGGRSGTAPTPDSPSKAPHGHRPGCPRTCSGLELAQHLFDDGDAALAALPGVADRSVVDQARGVGRQPQGRGGRGCRAEPARPRRRRPGTPRGRPTAGPGGPQGHHRRPGRRPRVRRPRWSRRPGVAGTRRRGAAAIRW